MMEYDDVIKKMDALGESIEETEGKFVAGEIYEAGLSRVITHAQDHSFAMISAFKEKPKDSNEHPLVTLRRNRDNNKKLLQHLNTHGMGPVLVSGHSEEWDKEKYPTRDHAAKAKAITKTGREESFYVPKPHAMPHAQFHQHMLNAAKAHNQDSVLVGQGKSHVKLWDPHSGKEITKKDPKDPSKQIPYFDKGELNLNHIADYHSYMRKEGRGRELKAPSDGKHIRNASLPKEPKSKKATTFAFEGVAYPTTGFDRMAFNALGLCWFNESGEIVTSSLR
jgi:hypothetical protein